METLFARQLVAAGLILLGAFAASTPGQAEALFSFAATPGQLPKTVVPQHYSLLVKPDLKTLSFQGREVVDLTILAPTRGLTLNQLGLQVSGVRLTDKHGRPSPTPLIQENEAAQTLTLTFPRTLQPGSYRLMTAYRGRIGRQAQGLYAVKYQTASGGTAQMLATQFEATDARRMFPGWDEPSFRATYRLNVVVPRTLMAVSNMPITRAKRLPGGLKLVSFGQTPPMASYLVVLVAGDLEAIHGKSGGTTLRVVTVRGKKEQGRYALGVMQKILPYYNSYFGVQYPLPKLDLIAVPGGFDGAMENWGGIVYNEYTLLFDPVSSSESTKRQIFSIVSHETAHQWFGDLVTMAWWDNLWLNEGFASWMAYKATDYFNPTWHVWEEAAADKSDVLEEDAVQTTHPIQQSVADPTQAAGAFDDITDLKGAAVIHMFESALGEVPFRDGIRQYMAAHAYSNTTTADLWTALEASSGQPMQRIAPGWTRLPGFPVVQVRRGPGGSGVILGQQPFAVDAPKPAKRVWQIPIVWQTLGSRTQHTLTLGAAPVSIGLRPGTTILLNSGNTGYYRVDYAPALLAPLATRLETLAPVDRVGLLGDTWALAQAGRVPVTEYLTLALSAQKDTDRTVQGQVRGSLGTLRFLEQGQRGQAGFESFQRSMLNTQFAAVGWEARPGEPADLALRRSALIRALGSLDDPAIIAQAQARFAAYVKNPHSLPPGLQRTVFSIVGRHADQATYDQLHALARTTASTEQKERFYSALAAAKDLALARQTLNLVLTDELDPGQTPELIFGVAFEAEHPDLAWQFVQSHRQAVLEKQGFANRVSFVPNLFAAFTDNARADELEADAKAHPGDDAPREVARAAAEIRFNAALKKRILPSVDLWVAALAITAVR